MGRLICRRRLNVGRRSRTSLGQFDQRRRWVSHGICSLRSPGGGRALCRLQRARFQVGTSEQGAQDEE